jgi:chemotaxis protein MotB
MSNGSDLPPRIVKKIRKHGGSHGGAWKVAYADFVTAMMALFIVLWVMAQGQEVQKAVASYFNDPIGISAGKGILNGSGPSSAKTEGIFDAQIAHQKEMELLKKIGQDILTELSKNPTFTNLMNQIKIEFVKEGLRIEIIDSVKNLFFEIGTSKLTKEAFLLLQKMGNDLSKIPNKIIVEGHTDSRPYNNGPNGYTNFELSSDRANSARRALTSDQLIDGRIEQVRGYADRILRNKEDPYSFVNRRISIIIKYTDTKE